MLPIKFQFIWPSGFRGEDLFKISQSETRIACGGHLLTDRDKLCNLYRGPPIDASYQVSVHLAKGFQRRRLKCEKLTDDRRHVPACDGKSSKVVTLVIFQYVREIGKSYFHKISKHANNYITNTH
jgi:hypothetical protein